MDDNDALKSTIADVAIDPIDIPNLNEEGLFQKLRALGFPVTRRSIKYGVLRRELIPVRIGRGNYLSLRDGLNWIESRRQPGVYHAPESQVVQ
jgi:hypothetical protein